MKFRPDQTTQEAGLLRICRICVAPHLLLTRANVNLIKHPTLGPARILHIKASQTAGHTHLHPVSTGGHSNPETRLTTCPHKLN